MQDQINWNDAYANAPYIPDADGYVTRWAQQAAAFRAEQTAKGRAKLGISYGTSARQAYDLFLPETQAKGLMIFVHGGYWLRFDRSDWSHFATGALARGWAALLPSYDLCPDVRIGDITTQIAQAICHAAAQIPTGPLTLAGHSAGGHLVARMLAPKTLPTPIAARIAQVVPISPVADLRPLLKTDMNRAFRLDEPAAKAESPVLQPAPDTPTHIWVGADERPAFLDQAKWLAAAWSSPLTIAPGKHHFDIIDALQTPDSAMMQTLCFT